MRTCSSSPSSPKLGHCVRFCRSEYSQDTVVAIPERHLTYVRNALALQSFTVATDIAVKSLITKYRVRQKKYIHFNERKLYVV